MMADRDTAGGALRLPMISGSVPASICLAECMPCQDEGAAMVRKYYLVHGQETGG